jgi:hypothetical protein
MSSASLLVWLFTRSLILPHEPATLVLSPRDFPSSGSVQGLVETAVPPITSDRFDAGGSGVGVPARFGAYGGSWTQTTYRLGDLDITNPLRPGTPMVLPDAAGLDGVSIMSAPSLADVSATGPRFDLRPLRPGTTPSFTFEGIFSSQGWAPSATDPPAIATMHALEDASFVFSGPIAGDQAGAVIAGRLTHATRSDRNLPPDQDATLGSLTANFVITPQAHEEIRVLGVYQQAEHPNEAWIALDDTTQARDRMSLLHLAWERSDPDRLAFRIAGGVQHAFLDPAASTAVPTIDSVNDGAILPIMLQPAGSTTSFRVAGDVGRPSSSSSPHDWRVGGTFERDVMHPDLLAARSATEVVNGEPARLWQFAPASSPPTWNETTGTIFASDAIKLGTRARVEASLRLESIAGSNGGTTSISWIDLYPRVAAKLMLWEAGGVGMFVDVSRGGLPIPPLALAFGDPNSPTGSVFTWTDANHDGVAEPSERGPLVAAVGPGAGSNGLSEIDPNLARPALVQTIVGLSIDRPRWAATISAIIRRESNLIQVEDPGAQYTLIQVPDEGINYPGPKTTTLDTYSRTPASFGLDHYVLTNPAGLTATFEGLDASLQLRSQYVVLAFGATAALAEATNPVRGFRVDENDPGVLDISGNPNALVNARGRPFYDRGYTGKLALAFRLPHEIGIGTIVRYQDGQPFSRLAVATGLAQGPEPIRAYTPGRTRFSFVGSVDLRVQKDFVLGRGRLGLFLDVFDLFNTTREVEEIVATSPDFRDVSAVEPPRSLRVGLRLHF